jgi:hypothetical protein
VGQVLVARTSRVVDDVVVALAAVDFGVEKEDKLDNDEDRDNGKGVGSHRNASERVCGCTLARYLTLTQNRTHLTLATVEVFLMIVVVV